MYPNLTPTLLTLLVLAFSAITAVALRRSFLRRLAFREAVRRRREATFVILGSMLGTAIIVGSLIVGDTLNFSVKQGAYENLGPIDETVTSLTAAQGRAVSDRLQPLRDDPRIDGMLMVHGDVAAASVGTGPSRRAEPQVGVWGVDFAKASRFTGGVPEGSGLGGPAPAAGQVVINQELADALGARAGDAVTFYLYGTLLSADVARVVPSRGLAGISIDGITRDAFFDPGTLQEAAAPSTAQAGGAAEPRTLMLISNRGGVEPGGDLSNAVTAEIDSTLGNLLRSGTFVAKSKQLVLDEARTTGDSLGSMFLMVGSFAIVAGILLLVNIFVMLAEERKPELGMLRAVGMRRSHLVRSFIIEGTIYATLASLAGVVVGIGMGRAVVVVAARIYSNFQAYTALHMVFHVTGISLINGLALGLLMALLTVAMTSLRISRINIIAAIRDLPSEEGRRMKLRWVIAATATAVLAAVLAVPAIASNEPNGTYVLPAIAAACLVPLLLRVAPKRLVYSGVALAIILWTLVANTVRPHLLLTSSTAVFIEIGLLLTFAGVVLLSENQELVTAPLRPLIDRASQLGLSTRLAVAYPLGKRFRTGAILIMFGLVVFTLVFITTLTSLIQGTVNRAAVSASGGFAVRADVNVTAPSDNPARSLISGGFGGKIEATAPLLAARATATDLAPEVTEPVDAVVVGFDQSMLASGGFRLIKRAPIFGTDAAAWDAVAADPRYAIVDNFIGQLNSDHPPQDFLRPGQVFTLTDPLSGRSEQKILAGTLDSSYALYGMGGGLYSPVLVNRAAAREQFGDAARPTSVLLRPAPGVAASSLASELQGTFLEQGLVATRIHHVVEESYASSNSFFQLMQGFIALGLLVGIAGLAVVMIRAVRERRRSIGVLRALGFQARTVQRAFLTESLFVTLEGVLLGTVLALITTYMLFKNYELFQTAGGGFSIPWLTIAIMGVAATIASVLATVWPARQASRIRPAVAIRIAD